MNAIVELKVLLIPNSLNKVPPKRRVSPILQSVHVNVSLLTSENKSENLFQDQSHNDRED